MKAINKLARALCAALCLALLPLNALAAQGDATILRRDDPEFLDTIEKMTASGDTLYLQGADALYTYRPGDAEPAAYAWDIDISAIADGTDWQVGRLTVADGENLRLFLHLSDQSGYVKTVAGTLTLSDGRARASDLREVAWPEDLISHYGNESYVSYCVSCFCLDGTMYLLSYGDLGYEAYAIQLDSMNCSRLPIDDVQMIAPYVDGQVLAASEDDGQSCTLSAYDPATEGVVELCEIDLNTFGSSIADFESVLDGLACDLQTGACYCICNGQLCPIDLDTGALGAALVDIPVDSSSRSGYVLDGGWHAYQSYQATLIRSLDPGAAPATHLKVYDGAYLSSLTSACFDFTNDHGDASVSISRDYNEQENLVQNMLSRDSRVDVYILSATDEAYNALYERGYMAELDSAALQDLVDRMYPGIQSAVTRDGKLIAVPVAAYCWTIGVNLPALERAGLSIDRIPENWPDFLDFLTELPELLEGTGVSAFDLSFEAGQMRSQLLLMILESWQDYARATMDVPAYDVPALRTILEKLERVDFEALGLPEAEVEDDAGTYMIASSGGYVPDDVLLNPGVDATFRNLSGDMHPLVLSVAPDAQALLTLDTAVAFVNPLSENIPLAIEFLEALAADLPEETLYNFIPSLNEPVRGKYFEAELKEYREKVDALKRDLDAAEDIDRPAIEAELNQAEAELADYEVNGMAVTQQSIDWFRAHDDCVTASGENWLYSDDSGEALDLVHQYLAGRIDLSRLLAGIDQKVQMMAQEGN